MSQWKSFQHATSARDETSLYKDRVVPARFTKPEKKFRVLFRDIFGHHVQLDSTQRTGQDADLLEGDKKRLIEQDEVSAIFREKFLTGFQISETSNESEEDVRNNLLEDWREIEEVCDPSIAFPYRKSKGYGNNRLSLIVGNGGQGKSLLLTKIISKVGIETQTRATGKMLSVYVNMESAWIKDSDGSFKTIDEDFWKLVYERLKGEVPRGDVTKSLREHIASISTDSLVSYELKIRDVCRILPEYGYYAVIVIDNIDRYHFSEVRHSFFDKYSSRLSDSIHRNISRVISKFNDLDALGRISATIIVVCRRSVYEHLIQSADGSDPNDNRLKGYSVFQVLEPTSQLIIEPRLATLKFIVDREIEVKRLNQADIEACNLALKVLNATIARKEGEVSHDGLRADVFDLLLDLSHQGPRGVIQYLSEFEFDVRKNSEAIERVFHTQPRNLLRLYVSNCRKRYSQNQNHFPNIFLVDCNIDPHPDFPLAYRQHRQTYWLKWIVLRLIDLAPGHRISFHDLHALLHSKLGYEDHLIRLVIGSLSTPNKSGCISVSYPNHSINSRELSLTRRAKALTREKHSKVLSGIPFCFSFDYLQMVSDDPLIAYPKQWADDIVPADISLAYTLRERDEYHKAALEYLRKKMPASLVFLQVLESSWEREKNFISDLGDVVVQKVSPNFAQIRTSLLSAFSAILNSWSQERDELYAELTQKSSDLAKDGTFNTFWEGYGE